MLYALLSTALAMPGGPANDVMQANTPGIAVAANIANVTFDDIGVPYNLSPLAGEEGHWTAVRFQPRLQFSLRRVVATFTNDPQRAKSCVVDIPHDVMIFVTNSATPPWFWRGSRS
jgi:hypothetical protein